jgi:hypothetical protein
MVRQIAPQLPGDCAKVGLMSRKFPSLPEEEMLRVEQRVPVEARQAGQRAHRAALQRFGRVTTVQNGQVGTLTSTGQFTPRGPLPPPVRLPPRVSGKLTKKQR